MSRPVEQKLSHQVSETAFHFLHTQIVHYNLHGAGARYFSPPPSVLEPDSEQDTTSSRNASLGDPLTLLTAKRKRLETLGHDVGSRLIEAISLNRDHLEQPLDMVKLICKDFWEKVFSKQLDVLRTNHRGLYVLTDNNFRWLRPVFPTQESCGTPEDYVVYPCGLVCGALTKLGLRCRVTAELVPLPTAYKCSFNVQLIQN